MACQYPLCFWELDRRRLDEARRYLDEIAQQWGEALERLRVFVEKLGAGIEHNAERHGLWYMSPRVTVDHPGLLCLLPARSMVRTKEAALAPHRRE